MAVVGLALWQFWQPAWALPIRGGILDNWGSQFGLNASQLGDINGAGFTGFCFGGIVIGGIVADKIGYGKLVFTAFALHVLSAVVTFAAGSGGISGVQRVRAYFFLYWGTFIFALANGTLEAVANPLVATLLSSRQPHDYLNILHASWPAGLVLGGVAGWIFGRSVQCRSWKIQLALFLGADTAVWGVILRAENAEVGGVGEGTDPRRDVS